MKEPFELEWMGGPAEHHFRKARPGIDDLPWGTLDTTDYPPDVVLAARATWTEAAYTEYRAIASFSAVLHGLCEAKAPLDLIGMASSFVADEVVHVELCSRLAMELGGGTPHPVDFEALTVKADPRGSAFQRANELVLRISCVAEAFSGHMAVSTLRTTTHPLTRAVLERIVADESLHYRLGGIYFEWACEQMDDAERTRLGRVALRALGAFAPMWKPRPRTSDAGAATTSGRYKATPKQVHEIGWVESRLFAEQARTAARDAIVGPLARYGITLPREEVDALLS